MSASNKSPETLRAGDRTREPASHLQTANIILTVAIILSLIFLFVFVRDRIRLKDRILQSEARVRQLEIGLSVSAESLSGPPAALVGDLVPPFEAMNLEGQPVAIAYNGSSKYLLFVFSPLCDACVDEMGKWGEVSKVAKANGYSVLAVSLRTAEETRMNLPKGGRDFQILIMPNMAVQRAYRVIVEPVVILVSAQGTVAWVHYGSLSQATITDLNSHLVSKS